MAKVRQATVPNLIPYTKFEDYKDKYKNMFFLERSENGVMVAKWHTNGDSLIWDVPIHRGIHQLCTDVGQDAETEVFIIGGSGKNWIADMAHHDKSESGYSEESVEDKRWISYEHMFYDGTNICEGLVNDLEIPTIGVINGPGFHTEMALFCDITLMADDAAIVDPHFMVDMVPGDGIQIAFRMAMGIKRANYAMLTCETIGPEKALQYGMVNEIVPKAKIYDRAKEIGEMMASKSRIMRRATVQLLRLPWKKALAEELRPAFATEMWAYMATDVKHDGGGGAQDKLMEDLGADMKTKKK